MSERMPRSVIVVTGSRDWTDAGTIHTVLTNACPDLVVVGCCPSGADKIARTWCYDNLVEYRVFVANWGKLGKRAGHDRNARMLYAYPHARVVAFPLHGPGTRDCVKQAQRLGMEVFTYQPRQGS